MNNTIRERIFLSYAKEDLVMARSIYDGLKKRKLNVWFDEKDLKPGRVKQQCMKAICRSRFFVICISEAALRKTGDKSPGFQDEELNWAYGIAMDQTDYEFSIVPVRIEDCDQRVRDVRLTSSTPYYLYKNFEKELDKLAVDLGGISLSDTLAEDARSKDEKLINSLMGKAETLYYARKYLDALKIWEAVRVYDPDYAGVLNNIGDVFKKLERHDEARAAYEKASKNEKNLLQMYGIEKYLQKKSFLGNISESGFILKGLIEYAVDCYSNLEKLRQRMTKRMPTLTLRPLKPTDLLPPLSITLHGSPIYACLVIRCSLKMIKTVQVEEDVRRAVAKYVIDNYWNEIKKRAKL